MPVRQLRSAEDRQPKFVVRAPDPQRPGRWLTLGAAWERADGGYNVKLNTVPVGNGWDGALVLLPPLGEEPIDLETGEVR